MPLQEKINEEELALVEILEDAVWMVEFIRSTSGGEIDTKLHPKDPWKMRWYQKDLMTDRTKHIVLTGGRSIGKCQPTTARVYTSTGYQTIAELLKQHSFPVYALDENKQLVIRRGKVYPDKIDSVFEVETDSGQRIQTTSAHPYLTPTGWKKLKQLQVGDYVAVATSLPEIQSPGILKWHELRFLGYVFLERKIGAEKPIRYKYKKQEAELQLIAKEFNCNVRYTENREIVLKRKRGYLKHNATWLLHEVGLELANVNGARFIPRQIMQSPNEDTKIFLEALFLRYGNLAQENIRIEVKYSAVADNIQELLLRFGIESKVERTEKEKFVVTLIDYRAVYRFWITFQLPGISVSSLPVPAQSNDELEYLRFDKIKKITLLYSRAKTYAMYVYDDHNYIGDNFYVHNSLVLEDKLVYQVVNNDIEFPVTPESLLIYPNQAQLIPFFNRLVMRFTSSPLLKWYLQNNVNKSQGTMTFPVRNPPFILHARIAGGNKETNVIGLHLPRIHIDEAQIFNLGAYTQLRPVENSWEPKVQWFISGVPSGLRNSVLYQVDQKSQQFKKYRIPSHNNPYFTREDDITRIRESGGENSDEYQQQVLGRHGSAAFQVLSAESITREPYDFFIYRYSITNKNKGETYQDALDRPKLPDGLMFIVAALDTGLVDPTVINVIGLDNKGIWRVYVRYRLTRIDFPEQERIFNWIDDAYHFQQIGIDIGPGGGGSGVMQGLILRDEYKHKRYAERIKGFNNSEGIVVGMDDNNQEIKQDAKSYAAENLVKRIEDGNIRFSEIDAEGTSELEKIAKIRSIGGIDRYFIMSDTGKGRGTNDHHFASMLVFALLTKDSHLVRQKKRKLGRSGGITT